MSCSFPLISLSTNILEEWDIIHLKGKIHIYVLSTKTFLYNIREPRYDQIKMGYKISKILEIGQSNVLNSDVPYCFTYISWLLMFYRNGFELEACQRMSPKTVTCPSLLKCSKLEKSCINLGSKRFKEIRMIIISNSGNLITHIVLLIPQLPDIVQKSFYIPDRDIDLNFQMNYVPVC